MKKTTKLLVVTVLAAIFIISVVFMSHAQVKTKQLKQQILQVSPKVAQPLTPKTDLKVEYIAGNCSSCKPEYTAVNAIYFKNKIHVRVTNNPLSGGAKAPTGGTVKLQFYNLATGAYVTKTAHFNVIKPAVTNPWWANVYFNGPFLVKKSTGVKAEVIPDSPVIDGNPSNNIKKVHDCIIIVE